MERRRIGSLAVSLVGLGCNNFGARMPDADVQAVVDAALDAGITFFDTADIYGGSRSEVLLGQALGGRRGDVVVATKFGAQLDGRGGASPTYVREACEASLRRLATDRIDLYQLHVPDPDTPIADTLGALDELVREGKVREVGCSNFSRPLLDDAASASAAKGTVGFASIQNHLSLLARDGEAELVEGALAHGLGILPYFPLANGMLTGKYVRGEPPPADTRLAKVAEERRQAFLNDPAFDRVDRLDALAAAQGRTLLELAFSWLAGLPAMASVIAGATKPEQVRANATAVGWELTAADREAVDAITLG